MFEKILIANRGEIAARVIRTARAMGIETVAVYSEADRDALHVRMADEAVFVGPPPSRESYLKIDAILSAAKQTGAEAIHPGYGFLSENAAFARALRDAGVVFIGPPPEAIAAMGDKIESKKLAVAAGINAIPGHLGAIGSDKEAVKIAREIGYPVMIKASAGGGGKGMRVVRSDEEMAEGFRAARSEAKSSFGDERVFVEKFIERPRHIEIQVLGDAHGNVVHLGERECSIQRRHQKVIEESPSPFLDEKTRKAMGEQAVALARAVGYVSAGTAEFVVDDKHNFYFLEMNTRLQVEHPVTELTTGLDLVELMIRIAAGEKLPFAQADVKRTGHAIECRIYAEDPARHFVPSPGRLVRCRPPEGMPGIRLDTGVEEGSEISLFYDPMIAKLCAFGADRDEAIARMRAALDRYELKGVSHNIGFLAAILGHPRFGSGDTTTDFIAEEYPEGFKGAAFGPEERARLSAVAVLVHMRSRKREVAPARLPLAVHPGERREWVVQNGGQDVTVRVEPVQGGAEVVIGGAAYSIDSGWRPGDTLFEGSVNGEALSVQIEQRFDGYVLHHGGVAFACAVRPPRAAELARLMPEKPPADTSKQLRSPMPGLVVAVNVAEGDEVKAGQPLAVVDAMKMENLLRAERDGRVARVRAKKGDSLAVDQVILEFE